MLVTSKSRMPVTYDPYFRASSCSSEALWAQAGQIGKLLAGNAWHVVS